MQLPFLLLLPLLPLPPLLLLLLYLLLLLLTLLVTLLLWRLLLKLQATHALQILLMLSLILLLHRARARVGAAGTARAHDSLRGGCDRALPLHLQRGTFDAAAVVGNKSEKVCVGGEGWALPMRMTACAAAATTLCCCLAYTLQRVLNTALAVGRRVGRGGGGKEGWALRALPGHTTACATAAIVLHRLTHGLTLSLNFWLNFRLEPIGVHTHIAHPRCTRKLRTHIVHPRCTPTSRTHTQNTRHRTRKPSAWPPAHPALAGCVLMRAHRPVSLGSVCQ